MKKYILILVVMALFIAGCKTPEKTPKTASPETMEVAVQTAGGSERVRVEIANNDEERQRGYMYRDEIPEGTGMWFVFQSEQPLSFWMKNTKVALDIIFVDKNFKIINIAKNATPCTDDPCLNYYSKGNAQFVLEVPAGYAEKHHFETGNLITFYGRP